jgi:glutathione synthase/RimK-type ligase-like ATP-grasp enzyme
MVALVCGLPHDEPVAMLINALNERGVDFRVLNPEALSDQIKIRWQLTEAGLQGQLMVHDEIINIRTITSVYQRWVNVEDVFGEDHSALELEKARSVLRAMSDLFDILPVRIVNRRRPMMSNNSKPYQSLLIHQAGFDIPETLITNEPGELAAFINLHKDIIYKSTGSTRSVVARYNDKDIDRVRNLTFLPTQFQQFIDGFNLRVHVIGRRAFATKILSRATDYRYASRDGEPVDFIPFELNVELNKRCIRLARIFGLDFAGIDLMVGQGKVYCLEVNPSPGYSYYQNATDQPISYALADYLAAGKPMDRS